MDEITDVIESLISLGIKKKGLCEMFREMLESNVDQGVIKDVYNMMGGYGINQIMMFSCGILPVELIRNGIKIDMDMIRETMGLSEKKKSKMKKPHSRIPGRKKKGGKNGFL